MGKSLVSCFFETQCIWNCRASIRPSVCPRVRLFVSYHSAAARPCGGFAALGTTGRRYRSIAAWPARSSNCKQCHVVSWRRKLNTELFVSLQTSVALKRAGFVVWQLECQASNVTTTVQSDHLLRGYIITVFRYRSIASSTTCTLPKRSSCLNKPLTQLVRIAEWKLGTHAPASFPRCSNQLSLVQDCWQDTCHDCWNGESDGAELDWVTSGLCRGALSSCKTNASPAILQITGRRSCVGIRQHVSLVLSADFCPSSTKYRL